MVSVKPGISGMTTKANTLMQDDFKIKVLYVDDQDQTNEDDQSSLKKPI